ncbi:DNA-binding response regulator [Limnospira fusiformis CCALA 023]|nr:MAG: DNA-binding response regulator [Arthrospira sp. PLM2.Bin9]
MVEDDPKLAEFIASELITLEGYQVTVASNRIEGLTIAHNSDPDMLILDWCH